MKSCMTVTYNLEDEEFLCVTNHGASVSISVPGFYGDDIGQSGFSIQFYPRHIEPLKRVIGALSQIEYYNDLKEATSDERIDS